MPRVARDTHAYGTLALSLSELCLAMLHPFLLPNASYILAPFSLLLLPLPYRRPSSLMLLPLLHGTRGRATDGWQLFTTCIQPAVQPWDIDPKGAAWSVVGVLNFTWLEDLVGGGGVSWAGRRGVGQGRAAQVGV